jgi:hypothetical protein
MAQDDRRRERMPHEVEHMLPGGIYWEGDDSEGDRTDVSLVECGTGEPGNPFTFMLTITTGNGSYNLCALLPGDVKRLGKWLWDVGSTDMRGM